MNRTVRAVVSLLLYLAGAVVLVVVLDPLIPVANPEFTQDAIARARGLGLLVALICAVVLWARPSLLPRRPR